MKKIKLNNVVFPIWFLFIFPVAWIVILPINFIIDSLVLLFSLMIIQIDNKRQIYKQCIFKIWIFGFCADLIGTFLLLMTQFLPSNQFINKEIIMPIMLNPWQSSYGLFLVIMVVIIVGIIIYFFNSRISLKKTSLTIKQKRIIAFFLAIITAPYLLLVPTEWFYHSSIAYTMTLNHSYIENTK